jgi:hypothetical protein
MPTADRIGASPTARGCNDSRVVGAERSGKPSSRSGFVKRRLNPKLG